MNSSAFVAMQPVTPSSTISGTAPSCIATTGVPQSSPPPHESKGLGRLERIEQRAGAAQQGRAGRSGDVAKILDLVAIHSGAMHAS